MNHDGIPDLVLVTGSLAVLLGRGDGTFEPVAVYDPSSGYSVVSQRLADVNNDGNLDVVVAGGSSGGTPQYGVSSLVTARAGCSSIRTRSSRVVPGIH